MAIFRRILKSFHPDQETLLWKNHFLKQHERQNKQKNSIGSLLLPASYKRRSYKPTIATLSDVSAGNVVHHLLTPECSGITRIIQLLPQAQVFQVTSMLAVLKQMWAKQTWQQRKSLWTRMMETSSPCGDNIDLRIGMWINKCRNHL